MKAAERLLQTFPGPLGDLNNLQPQNNLRLSQSSVTLRPSPRAESRDEESEANEDEIKQAL